jgi:hypothetical protein
MGMDLLSNGLVIICIPPLLAAENNKSLRKLTGSFVGDSNDRAVGDQRMLK